MPVAISSGTPCRPSGTICSTTRSCTARPPMKSMAGWLNGVSIQPGHIALTRIFAGATSAANAFVKAMIAPFDAL